MSLDWAGRLTHSRRMVILLSVFVLLVVLFPLFFYFCTLLVNQRHGSLVRIRSETPGFWWKVVCGWLNSIWSTALIGASYPFQRLLARKGTGQGVPVLLVHGLYHNHAAWLFFGRWLQREGYDNLTTVSYNSFTRTYPEIVQEVGRVLERIIHDNPGSKVLLVGHSLGGLVIHGLLAEKRFQGCFAGVVTLGTPHQGSALGRIAIGRLGRSLRPDNPLFHTLRALPEPEDVPRLSIFAPLDSMVMPEPCLRIHKPGWREERWSIGVSHVGLIYHRPLARRVARFFREIGQPGD
ncbi:MAG: alpha/beta fold hydrolase [Desulfovibrionaceae bacterium]